MKTSQDLFKQLDEVEALFSKGSIKIAQKKVREVISKSKELEKVPNKLRHKLNFAIGQSRYFDDMSSFATNPKREELIKEITKIVENSLENPKKQAHLIHEIQTKWQLLDLSSRPASKEQWNKFNELTNKAWEPCSEYFDELKQIKINNATQRIEIINNINKYVQDNSSNWPKPKYLIQFLRQSFDDWQKFAPVLDKDLNKLRNAYFEAKKPINDAIKKQEQIVIKAKEALIEKVNAISDEDNDICIKKFNDLKNEWKNAGSAGRKADNKLWDKFKRVRFHYSIDSIGVMNDYIRYPSKWDHQVKQMHLLDNTDDNVEVTLACAVQALNIYYIPDFIKWKLDEGFKKINMWPFGAGAINYHFVYHPPQLNVKILPQWFKDDCHLKYVDFYGWWKNNWEKGIPSWYKGKVSFDEWKNANYGLKGLKGLITFMKSENWSNRMVEFVEYITIMDRIRGTNFKETFPEMKGLL